MQTTMEEIEQKIVPHEREINLTALMKDFERFYTEFDQHFRAVNVRTNVPCFVTFGVSGAGKVSRLRFGFVRRHGRI